MSVAAIIETARAAGIRFWLDGERVRMRAPAPPPPDLLATLRAHRDEVAAYLRENQYTPGYAPADYAHREAAAIGSARPPAPARRCPSCGCGLQPADADLSLCSTCRWSAEHLAPSTVQ